MSNRAAHIEVNAKAEGGWIVQVREGAVPGKGKVLSEKDAKDIPSLQKALTQQAKTRHEYLQEAVESKAKKKAKKE